MQTATTNQSSDQPNLMGLDACGVWDTTKAFEHLQGLGGADCKRTAERRLQQLSLLPQPLAETSLNDELGRAPNQIVFTWLIEKARAQRKRVLMIELGRLPNGKACLFANDARNERFWYPLKGSDSELNLAELLKALSDLQEHIGKEIIAFPHGDLVGLLRNIQTPEKVCIPINAYLPNLEGIASSQRLSDILNLPLPTHLKRLEDESIFIIREAVAEAQNPVMLYSIGKDSAVMLHLARKAFYPAPPPFPLLHVDTRWKFQEMYQFRDAMAKVSGMELLVHTNPEAIARDINPFDHGSALHTDITKTEGLKQALDKYQFDVVFGGARRDEEKSRAKERVFSFRSQTHRWDPKQQRPELWNLYNTQKNKGESIRVFPLSNWTELDIWQYILLANIPVVPLYFAKHRPVVERDGMLLMVDDARFKLLPCEEITEKLVRFRTLGCYPLTGAIESKAANLEDIILELIKARSSERQGRAIDSDAAASMEKKKQEGYF